MSPARRRNVSHKVLEPKVSASKTVTGKKLKIKSDQEVPIGNEGLDRLANTDQFVTVRAQESVSLPGLSPRGKVSASDQAAYIKAIRHAVPAIAQLFETAAPEPLEKPLAARSTEELVIQIESGRFVTEIARVWRVSASELNKWISADLIRFARARLARKNQAALWDWVALQVLLHAPSDRVEIARAEKIARHCRWRAEAFSREEYGQNIKLTQADDRTARELTTQELEIIARGGVLPG